MYSYDRRAAKDRPTTTIEVDLPADCEGVHSLLRLLAHLRHLGGAGASRGIDIQDAKTTITGWDGDGSDAIFAIRQDGEEIKTKLTQEDVDNLYDQ